MSERGRGKRTWISVDIGGLCTHHDGGGRGGVGGAGGGVVLEHKGGLVEEHHGVHIIVLHGGCAGPGALVGVGVGAAEGLKGRASWGTDGVGDGLGACAKTGGTQGLSCIACLLDVGR